MSKTKRTEKGLLTPDNCVVTLIDLQPQMLFGVSSYDRQSIINCNVALAKAAKVFEVPVVLSTVETKSFSGIIWPQIRAVFPEAPLIERSFMNSWDDKNFVAAIAEDRQEENRSDRVVDRNLRGASNYPGAPRRLRDLCGGGLLRRCQPARARQRHEARRPGRREAGHVALRNARVAA